MTRAAASQRLPAADDRIELAREAEAANAT
jgi:hypothetical protein